MPAESFAQEVAWPTLDNLLALKSRWNVSVAAMIARCRDLFLLNEQLELRLWKGRSARGWTKGEPGDDTLPLEHPKLMMRGVHLLIDSCIFDRDALINQIGLPSATIEMLCNLRPGYLSQIPSQDNIFTLKLKPRASRIRSTGQGSVLPLHK